jgi:hypothetical protein
MECGNCTSESQRGDLQGISILPSTSLSLTHDRPIQNLKPFVVVEAVIYGWYCRTPHEQDHSEIIELVPDHVDARTMVVDDVKAAICQLLGIVTSSKGSQH